MQIGKLRNFKLSIFKKKVITCCRQIFLFKKINELAIQLDIFHTQAAQVCCGLPVIVWIGRTVVEHADNLNYISRSPKVVILAWIGKKIIMLWGIIASLLVSFNLFSGTTYFYLTAKVIRCFFRRNDKCFFCQIKINELVINLAKLLLVITLDFQVDHDL